MKLYAIGGYNEVGKNMTAVEVRNEIVILDEVANFTASYLSNHRFTLYNENCQLKKIRSM